MNKNDGIELEILTNERIDKYNSMVDKKIIFTRTELIKKYPYESAIVKKMVIPEYFGITDRFFGGNAHKCAILKNSEYVLIVNKFFKTIGIFVPKENLSKFTVEELHKFAEWLRIPVEKTFKKSDLVNSLTNS